MRDPNRVLGRYTILQVMSVISLVTICIILAYEYAM